MAKQVKSSSAWEDVEEKEGAVEVFVKVMNQEQLGLEQQHARSRWTHDASSLGCPECLPESRRRLMRAIR